MPFKSVAQRDRALRMLEAGEIDTSTFNKWDEGTPDDLPERLHPKKGKVAQDGSPGYLPAPGPDDMA